MPSGSSRNAEVVTEERLLIPHTTTVPASNRLIAGRVIGRKDCPALYTCVCNYFSNQGDKWHDWFLSAGSCALEMGGLSAVAAVGSPDHKQKGCWGELCPPLLSTNNPDRQDSSLHPAPALPDRQDSSLHLAPALLHTLLTPCVESPLSTKSRLSFFSASPL